VVSVLLYNPFGIAGVVLGTAVSNAVMTLQQAYYLRRELRGFEVLRTLRTVATMVVASAALGGVAYGAWRLLDAALGRSLPAQVVSVGVALAAGFAVYAALVLLARVPEAQQAARLIRRRTGA
jgi:putative peptidoglycan lipid II flippase